MKNFFVATEKNLSYNIQMCVFFHKVNLGMEGVQEEVSFGGVLKNRSCFDLFSGRPKQFYLFFLKQIHQFYGVTKQFHKVKYETNYVSMA